MSANDNERNFFIEHDMKFNTRKNLLEILKNKNFELGIDKNIDIVLGGLVGITIYPKKWNKSQILKYVENNYKDIYYFGDRYDIDGNDYELINNNRIIGKKVDNTNDTLIKLNELL